MLPSSPALMVLPCLAAAWVATLLIIARYRIARRVLDKTEPQRLPEVLRDLISLINGTTRTPTNLTPYQVPPPGTPTRQAKNATGELDEEAQ
jgi:hypothetical protein